MYDCGFGDCFKLTDDSENVLYVDFGIHVNSKIPNKDLRYEQIINDMPCKCDFLLTHYHFDHYSGAIYMANLLKSGKIKQRFRDVYIPDVWEINGSVEIINLILLRGLITKSVLRDGISLIDFLKAICYASGKIHFVKRGTDIQNRYIALWPNEDHVHKETNKLIESMLRDIHFEDGSYRIIFERLYSISERLREQIVELSRISDYDAESKTIILSELESLGEEYNELFSMTDFNKKNKNKLFKYGNDISIVLQNSMLCDKNIIFTGDLKAKSAWNFIESNSDGKIPLHNKYYVIKIPHHGTDSAYHSFVNKCDDKTTLLIPNGLVSNFSWYISCKYSYDANSTRSSVICSDNRACKATAFSCVCTKSKLVSGSGYYIDL